MSIDTNENADDEERRLEALVGWVMFDMDILERRGDVTAECAERMGDVGVIAEGDFFDDDEEEKRALNRLGDGAGFADVRGRSSDALPVVGALSKGNALGGGFDGDFDGGKDLSAFFSGDESGSSGGLDWVSNSNSKSPT